ncbi:DUF1549 domain-containing protein [bacterium]|nr:DUF1549 domain-containing protein [bacterium]
MSRFARLSAACAVASAAAVFTPATRSAFADPVPAAAETPAANAPATAPTANTPATAPLHERIDQLVEKFAVGPRSEIADDLTFLRRVSLDLIGRVPSSAEARAFLADNSPNKRQAVVDRLLATPDFPRNLAGVFDVMLMERRGNKHVKTDELRAWLQKSFESDRSYLDIVTSLLAADGSPDDNRAAAAFYLERDVEPNLLTREVGRMFFGVDLQCAQCHNHPLIDDYLQTDYYGLFAFVNRMSVFQPDTKKPALITEAATGDTNFKSVFTEREAVTGPRLPGGAEFTEPVFATGDEYATRPDKDVRGIPKYSRRQKLAELVGAGGNDYFDRNIANRLWAVMLGRGLVHPVDQHHSDNPATNPELLDLLAREFADNGYKVRPLLREIALTQVYQRSYRLPADLAPSAEVAKTALPDLKVKLVAEEQATDVAIEKSDAALAKLDEALAAAKPVREAFNKVNAAAVEAAKKRDAAVKTLTDKQNALNAKLPTVTTVEAALLQASAAAKLISDDTELAAAAATLQKKFDALAAERKKLEDEITAAKKPVDDTQAALVVAQEATKPEREKLEPAEETIRQARAAYVTATEEVHTHRRNKTYMRRRIEFLQTLVALAEAEQRLKTVRPALPVAVAEATKAQETLAIAQKAMAEAEAAFNQASQTLQNTTAQLTQAQTSATQMASATQLVKVSRENAQAAAAKLSSDQELAAALKTLTAREATFASTSQQLTESVAALTKQRDAAQTAVETATGQRQTATQNLQTADAAAKTAIVKRDSLQQELTKLEVSTSENSEAIIQQASSHFNIAVLEALTAEQLGWSLLEATGQLHRQVAAERAKLDKEKPLSEAEQKDPAKVAQREQDAYTAAVTALDKTVAGVANLYAAQTGQPQDAFFATVDQALYLANGSTLTSWLNPSGDNLTARLQKLEDARALADELYLSILTRQPTAEETASVQQYLQQRADDRPAAVRELAWALLTSVEFRFHH